MSFFKDEKPLTAENFSLQHNRTFRSSQIVPYAANLVFVLYECSDGLRIQLFLNEKLITFPNMNHSAPLYETVRNHYSKLLNGCEFNKECNVPQSNLRNTELWVRLLNSGLQGLITVHLQWLHIYVVFLILFFSSCCGWRFNMLLYLLLNCQRGGHLCFKNALFVLVLFSKDNYGYTVPNHL